MRGGGIVATTGSSSTSTRASLDIIGNELCKENEHGALLPATDANIHNDTNYSDSNPVMGEEDEDASTVSVSSATTNTDTDTTPPTKIQYVIKKDGTIEPFEKVKVRKAKGFNKNHVFCQMHYANRLLLFDAHVTPC